MSGDLIGGSAALGASFLWAGSMSLYRAHGNTVPAERLNFFKNSVTAIAILAIALVVWPEPPREVWIARDLAISGVLGIALGDTLLFAALKRLGAQLTSALQCLVPVVTATLGLVFLGESLGALQTLGLLLTTGSVGGVVWFSTRPAETTPRAGGIAFGLLACFAQAFGIIAARHALPGAGVLWGTLCRLLPALLVLVFIVTLGNRRSSAAGWAPKGSRLALGLAAFLGGVLGLLLFTTAIKFTKAGVAAALSMSYPLWILPIARFGLKEKISWQVVAFTSVAVLGIVLLLSA